MEPQTAKGLFLVGAIMVNAFSGSVLDVPEQRLIAGFLIVAAMWVGSL